METSTSMLLFAAKYGVSGAVISIVISILLFVLGMSDSGWGNLSFLVLLGVILWGQYDCRKSGTARVGYGKSVGLGVLITIYLSVLTVIFSFIYLSYIDTETLSRELAATEEAMRMQGLPEENIEIVIKTQSYFITPAWASAIAALIFLITGTIMSLISSIFMKTE